VGVATQSRARTSAHPPAPSRDVQRGSRPGVSLTEQTRAETGYGGWVDLLGVTVDPVSAAIDGVTGLVGIFSPGVDGRVPQRPKAENSQLSAGDFTEWTAIGA
jgi:hypothetical protein